MAKRTLEEIRELIGELTEETKRRRFGSAPVKSRRVTDEVRASVRAMAAANPDMSQQALAEAHDINIGRISEILHGKR